MNQKRIQFFFWLLLSLCFLAACTVVVLISYNTHPGYDIWFHIKNGELILKNGFIHHTDQFLYSTKLLPLHYFPNYEWFFGVLSYLVYWQWNLVGIFVLQSFLSLSIFILLFCTAWKKGNNFFKGTHALPIISLFVTFIAFTVMVQRIEPRPHLLSALFLGLYSLLLTVDKLQKKHYFAFILITIIWANSHIEILFGFMLVFLNLLQTIISLYLLRENSATQEQTDNNNMTKFKAYKRVILERSCLLVLILLAIFLSPASSTLLTQGLDYYSCTFCHQYINEMNRLGFDLFKNPYGIMLILGILSFSSSFFVRGIVLELITFLPFAILPFVSVRHILPSSIVLIPIITANLQLLRNIEFQRKNKPFESITRFHFLMCTFFLVMIFLAWKKNSRFYDQYNRLENLPVSAIDFLDESKLEGNIFSPYHWGNFLVYYDNPLIPAKEGSVKGRYKLPRTPFIDGMIQTYNQDLLSDYLSFYTKPEQQVKISTKYNFNIALLEYPISRNSENFNQWNYFFNVEKNWKLIYWDETSLLLAKTELAKNARIPGYKCADPVSFIFSLMNDEPYVEKCSMDDSLEELNQSIQAKPSTPKLIWKTVLDYKKSGSEKALTKLSNYYLKNPRDKWALLGLGYIYLKIGKKTEARKYFNIANKQFPDSYVISYYLGKLDFLEGEYSGAKMHLKKSLKAYSAFQPAKKMLEMIESLRIT